MEIEPTDHQGYYAAAPLLVQTGDRATYEKLCASITNRFAGATNLLAASRMAQDCLLLPRPGVDLRVESALASAAITAGQKDRTSQCAMALAEYRQGHWDKARDWALKLAERSSPYSHSQAYAILAMAQYQLKETEAARAALKKGIEIVQAQLPKLDAGNLGPDWRDCIIAYALQSEAKKLIEGETSAAARPADLPR